MFGERVDGGRQSLINQYPTLFPCHHSHTQKLRTVLLEKLTTLEKEDKEHDASIEKLDLSIQTYTTKSEGVMSNVEKEKEMQDEHKVMTGEGLDRD